MLRPEMWSLVGSLQERLVGATGLDRCRRSTRGFRIRRLGLDGALSSSCCAVVMAISALVKRLSSLRFSATIRLRCTDL